MTIHNNPHLWCDSCGNWIELGSVSKRELLKHAKKEGWSRDVKSAFMDLCPKCLKETEGRLSDEKSKI